MMDFFSSMHGSSSLLQQQSNDFARAIASRPMNMPPALALPPTPPTPSSSRPTATATLVSPQQPTAFDPVTPASLSDWLYDPTTLILDIRPHAAYSSARVPGAVSLSVPSTLLKRPLFSLQRLSAMLSSRSARNRFSAWPTSKRILVYDADAGAIPETSNINGLLRKFKNDGFEGELAWLKGGFQSVWKERKELVDTRPPTPEAEHDDDEEDNIEPSLQPSILRTRQLPTHAFSLQSTLLHNSPHSGSKRGPLQLKHSQPSSSSAHHPAVNPFFDTIRQNVELSHGITEHIPLQLPRRVRRRLDDLQPFPWLHRISKRAGKLTPRHPPSSDPSSDDSTDEPAPGDTYANTLANQFYSIELAEQRRLMGIMQHHSKESGPVADNVQDGQSRGFPYSITAGVEKGAKNRYRHIWPFEHARVKLHHKDDDYVNASYVQPLFTNKRYIATQGPLPATYVDFWTLCWEQNVHVIVMLTREVEGAMVKCGSYWSDQEFGALRLRLVSTTGVVDAEEPVGFFSAHPSFPQQRTPTFPQPASTPRKPHHYHKGDTIKRVFELTHTGFPGAKPRKIVHLQFLDWPDMNVPDDPRGVLGLIKQVDEVVANLEEGKEAAPPPSCEGELDPRTGISTHALRTRSPVLLHCSAGVGRTGGFIAVDAILDAIRREVQQKKIPSGSYDKDLQRPIVENHSGKTSSGHTIHVSAPKDMQVDESDIPPPTEASEASIDFTRDSFVAPYTDTQQWAENVGVETGYGMSFQESSQLEAREVTPLSSLESVGAASLSSSSEDSSSAHGTIGSIQGLHPSSSSLGTSVSSGTRPLLDAAPLSKAGTMMIDHYRERTSSAPAPTGLHTFSLRRAGAPPSLNLGLGQLHPSAASSTPALSTMSTMQQSASPATSVVPIPSHPGATNVQPSESSVPLATGVGSMNDSPNSLESKEPRPLHDVGSPLPLEGSAEPVWELVQDMREQRMSLCQSLRQYVFVHTAIIEGALMVLDEEKEKDQGSGDVFSSSIDMTRMRERVVQPRTAPSRLTSQPSQPQSRSSSVSSRRFPSSPPSQRKKRSSSRRQSPSPTESSASARVGYPIPHLLFQQALSMESTSSLGGMSSASHGKRSASPTELTKEGMQGEVLLSKRPSVKRKSDTGVGPSGSETDGSVSGAELADMIIATPSASSSINPAVSSTTSMMIL